MLSILIGSPRSSRLYPNCAYIDMSDYKWVSDNCRYRYGYICKKSGNVVSPTTPTTNQTVPPTG